MGSYRKAEEEAKAKIEKAEREQAEATVKADSEKIKAEAGKRRLIALPTALLSGHRRLR